MGRSSVLDGSFIVYEDDYFLSRKWGVSFLTDNHDIKYDDIDDGLYEYFESKEEAVMAVLMFHPTANIMVMDRAWPIQPKILYGKVKEMQFHKNLHTIVKDGIFLDA